MSLRAFISPNPELQPGDTIALDAEESHYLVRVRRAKLGTPCELLDRHGQRYHARVTRADARTCTLEITAQPPPLTPGPERELWLGIPDAAALLAALSRATELGCARVRLLNCEHSQARLPSSARIARCFDAAMRQCGRPQAPQLLEAQRLDVALLEPWSGASFVAAPARRTAPTHIREQATRVAVGPEGGFSAQEQRAMEQAGFAALWLGPFVLRSEVAVTAALARLHT